MPRSTARREMDISRPPTRRRISNFDASRRQAGSVTSSRCEGSVLHIAPDMYEVLTGGRSRSTTRRSIDASTEPVDVVAVLAPRTLGVLAGGRIRHNAIGRPVVCSTRHGLYDRISE